MKNGVPLDVAEALEPVQLEGWSIIFSNFERPPDQRFNCNTMKFNEGKK